MSEQKMIERIEAKKLGLLRYFTGGPCAAGHITARLVSNKRCVECHNLSSRISHKAIAASDNAAGVCSQCRAARSLPGRLRCGECLANHKTKAADKRQLRRINGLCIVCGFVAPIAGVDYCEGCKNRNDAARIKRRSNRFASDPRLCRTCAIRQATNGSSCAECYEKHGEYRRRFRLSVLNKYGGRCACCGETEPDFLTIDHVNGRVYDDGKREDRSGFPLYLLVKRQGYPADYQVLCWNCNCAKGKYGSCPHTRALDQRASPT